MSYRLLPLLLVLFLTGAEAKDYLPSKWWPSTWGADDERGALNRLTPAKTLAAASLIQTGTIYDMGRVFEEEMPLFSLTPKPRKYSLTIPGAPSWGPLGENKLLWNEDYIAGHLSQNGIYAIENLDFDRLIEAKGYEFAFVVGTLPLKGATGPPVRPFAIK